MPEGGRVTRTGRWPRYGVAAIAGIVIWVAVAIPLSLANMAVFANGYTVEPVRGLIGLAWQPLVFAMAGLGALHVYGGIRKRNERSGIAWPMGTFVCVLLLSVWFVDVTNWWSRPLVRCAVDVLFCFGAFRCLCFLWTCRQNERSGLAAWAMLIALTAQNVSFSHTAMRLYAWRNLAEYEERIAHLTAQDLAKGVGGVILGVEYTVESHRPLIVAMEIPGRMLDNWLGLVYDESGFVVHAMDEVSGEAGLRRRQRAREMFGGTIYYVIAVTGSWYVCAFT
jgi:hypothetical protein